QRSRTHPIAHKSVSRRNVRLRACAKMAKYHMPCAIACAHPSGTRGTAHMKTWLMAALVVLALSACGAPASQTPPETARATPAPDADTKFLTAAAMYESFQIQAAELAAAHGQSAAVKTYAANAATAHRATLDDLLRTADAAGMAAPRAVLNED